MNQPHHAHAPTRRTGAPIGQRIRGVLTQAAASDRRRREDEIKRLQSDPRFDRLRSLPARRALVGTGYLALFATVAITWADFDGLASVAAPTAFLIGVGIAFALRRVIRHVDEHLDAALDERLVVERDAAFRTGYLVLTWATLAALLGLLLAGDIRDHHVQALFYGFALTAVLTPTSILAWTQPEV